MTFLNQKYVWQPLYSLCPLCKYISSILIHRYKSYIKMILNVYDHTAVINCAPDRLTDRLLRKKLISIYGCYHQIKLLLLWILLPFHKRYQQQLLHIISQLFLPFLIDDIISLEYSNQMEQNSFNQLSVETPEA